MKEQEVSFAWDNPFHRYAVPLPLLRGGSPVRIEHQLCKKAVVKSVSLTLLTVVGRLPLERGAVAAGD